MTTTTRRRMLKGLTASAAIPIAGTVSAAGIDPHAQWLADWIALRDRLDAFAGTDAQGEILWNEWNDLAIKLANTPAKTKRGLAAQFEWFRQDFGHYVLDMIGSDFANTLDVIGAGIKEVV